MVQGIGDRVLVQSLWATDVRGKKSSVVPGDNSAARERFKMLAFKNTLVQAHKRLGGMERCIAGSVSNMTGRVLKMAGDMNLGTQAVQACLSEVASETNQTMVCMSSSSSSDHDWIVSNVAEMEGIHMQNITPVDSGHHAVVGAKFTKAIGDIAPIPRCIAGSEDARMAELSSFLKERRQRQAKEAEDRQRLEEENDPTSRVQGEVRPQPAIATEQCTVPPTPVQPTEIDLRSPMSPADDDKGERRPACRTDGGYSAAPLLPKEVEVDDLGEDLEQKK